MDKQTSKVDGNSLLYHMKQIVNVRDYKNTPVDEEILQQLFEVFRYGPSLANHQPWEILLLDNEQKKLVVESTTDPLFTKGTSYGQPWINDVPVVFVVMIDIRRSEARIGTRGLQLSMQDVFSAIQNLRLVSVIKGLATSVVREFDVVRLNEILNTPDTFLPVAIITAGYPENEPELPPLLTVEEFVHKGSVK